MAVQPLPRWRTRRRHSSHEQAVETDASRAVESNADSPAQAHPAHNGLLFTSVALTLAIAIAAGLFHKPEDWWLGVAIFGPVFAGFRAFFTLVLHV